MITREQALEYLRRGIGNPAADFREGQWEAIDGILHMAWGKWPRVESVGNADACALRTGQVARVGAAEINYHGKYRRLGA